MPIIEKPFKWIELNTAVPFLKCSTGSQYILVIMNYATQFPEMVPLHSVMTPKIAVELMKWVGQPMEICTVQGKNLMSRVLKGLCGTLRIKHIRTAVYHPQTDGLVQRFNKTLSEML